MSSIFPIREKVSLNRDPEPRLVDLDEETADEVFEALASTTTREIFLELHSQPQTASDLAEVTETSVQNVQYHLEKLEDVDLVEVVDTWYSERGSEMKVYAPQDESLVLFAGRDKQGAFRRLLNRFAGLFALLVPPSILAGWLANRGESGDRIRGEYAGGQDTPSETFAEAGGDDAGTETEAVGAESDVTAADAEDSTDGGDTAATETAEEESDMNAADTGEDSADGGDGVDVAATEEPAATGTPTESATPTPDTADGTPTPTPDGGMTETPTGVDNQSVEIVVDNSSELTAGNDTVYLAVEGANSSDFMGVDPSVALAFFVGGLVVYGVVLLRRRGI